MNIFTIFQARTPLKEIWFYKLHNRQFFTPTPGVIFAVLRPRTKQIFDILISSFNTTLGKLPMDNPQFPLELHY